MTSPLPAVSVVLPTHDRAATVVEAARSVLDQRDVQLELIVVDDASTDDSAERLAAIDDARLVVVRLESNVGGAAARNAGIARARHDWIAFQDSDDLWRPEKLRRQLRRLCEGDAEVAYCAFERESADGRRRRVPPAPAPQGQLLDRLLVENFIGTPALVVRRELLRRVGGFDEALGRFQDWELAIRLAAASEIVCVDEPLFLARAGADGITDGHSARLLEAERHIVDKHRELIASRGPELLAHRYWHLGHVHIMAGEVDRGRDFLRRATEIRPRAKFRLFELIARSPSLYRRLYRLLRGA